MREIKKMICILPVLAICACLTLTVCANDSFQAHTSSNQLIAIIAAHEGFVAEPMTDATGTYIGYGSQYSDAVALFGEGCEPITEEQAAELTRHQLDAIDTALNQFLEANAIVVNQNQYDALADFTYGVGIGWIAYVNADDGTWCKLKIMLLDEPSTWTEERVREAFGTWVYAGGVKLEALVRVRAMEAELFLTPDSQEPGLPEPIFSDVTAEDWFYDSVTAAKELGLMNGNGDGTFSPNQAMTRAELVVALANFAGANLNACQAADFTDVPNTWYTAAVAWASDMGYVTGYEDGTFQPMAAVTREQICCVLARYLREQNISVRTPSVNFLDKDEISDYAELDVAYCSALGIVTGRTDGSFEPKSGASRAEAAAMLVRMAAIAE